MCNCMISYHSIVSRGMRLVFLIIVIYLYLFTLNADCLFRLFLDINCFCCCCVRMPVVYCFFGVVLYFVCVWCSCAFFVYFVYFQRSFFSLM